MILKRFSFQVTFRVALILGNAIIIGAIFGDGRLLFNQIILLTIFVFQVWELLWFFNITNREVTRFFKAVQESDFTSSFTKKHHGKTFDELLGQLQVLTNTFKKIKEEKEAQYLLIRKIVDQVPSGIIVVDSEGEFLLTNRASQNLLKIDELPNWGFLEANRPDFHLAISNYPGQGRFLQDLKLADQSLTFSIVISEFSQLNKSYKLITFYDIKGELEQNEIDAWHKLIRILTHEIMNSVTPISSLTETMELMLTKTISESQDSQNQKLPILEDLLFSIKTIQKRSDGLLDFVEDYRKITKIPEPELTDVDAKEFLEQIVHLSSTDFNKRNIECKLELNSDSLISLDVKQIEQVIINLLKNSVQALSDVDHPAIHIRYIEHDEAKVIEVKDNGPGISKEDMQDIWVPFYTTKTDGSGIGLSLSKQIMKLHGGTISVKSQPGVQTIFQLTFKK